MRLWFGVESFLALVLDSSALIALERNDRPMWKRLKKAQVGGRLARTHAGVLGQVWRGGHGQARLAQALSAVEVLPLDFRLGRAAGELLGRCQLSDVIGAGLVLLADDGDDIVTDVAKHLSLLVAATGRHVEIIKP